MNKESLEILKHLGTRTMPVSIEYLTNQFGANAPKYVQDLVDLDYVKEGTSNFYVGSRNGEAPIQRKPNQSYRISGAGRVFLECRGDAWFDCWFTRIVAIASIIISIIALFT